MSYGDAVRTLVASARPFTTSSFCPKIPSCPVGCGGWLIVEPERNGCFGPHCCCQLLLLIIFIVIFSRMLRPSEEEGVLQKQAALLE